jgi:MFS family permease
MFSCFHSYNIGVVIFGAMLGFSYGFIPAAFTIYFPELFPTRIRSTAEGFCYSTGRAVTALGVLFSGNLVQFFNGDIGRTASMMSIAFLIGAFVSLFAPETNKEIPLE